MRKAFFSLSIGLAMVVCSAFASAIPANTELIMLGESPPGMVIDVMAVAEMQTVVATQAQSVLWIDKLMSLLVFGLFAAAMVTIETTRPVGRLRAFFRRLTENKNSNILAKHEEGWQPS